MTRLDGETVGLLGGGSGFGLAVSRRVVAAGRRVVLGGRTSDKLADAAAQLGDPATWQRAIEGLGRGLAFELAPGGSMWSPGTVDMDLCSRRPNAPLRT